MNVQELYQLWLEKVEDTELRSQLEQMDEKEVYEAFYTELEFGTGGIRGVMGPGTNRMNRYIVARATAGMAAMLLKKKAAPAVAIGYDSRNHSEEFAKVSAAVLATRGIKVYLYPSLRPTPMVSFAIRQKECDAGIMITASHNPAKYNGYKAYGPDGCQLDLEDSKVVMDEIRKLDLFADCNFEDFDSLLAAGKICLLTEETDKAFEDACLQVLMRKDVLKKSGLKVVYTPLHGAGNLPVRNLLKRAGLENVSVVKAQELPDGNFPTAPYPNPEIAEAMKLGTEQMAAEGADILIATDPDSDRVGIALPTDKGPVLVTGNEMGVLLCEYLFSTRLEQGTLPEKPVLIKTIVTSPMCDRIVTSYGGEVRDVLTGFKFIGEQIRDLEDKGETERYILGFEESYGYLPRIHARDKDAVCTALLICEMAAYYRTQGKTLLQVLNELYTNYGFYLDAQDNLYYEGSDGMKTMSEIMANLLANPPKEVGGVPVVEVRDYAAGTITKPATGETRPTGLPSSKVLKLILNNCCSVAIRPSGTEPKIKLYYSAVSDKKNLAQTQLENLKRGSAVLLGR